MTLEGLLFQNRKPKILNRQEHHLTDTPNQEKQRELLQGKPSIQEKLKKSIWLVLLLGAYFLVLWVIFFA